MQYLDISNSSLFSLRMQYTLIKKSENSGDINCAGQCSGVQLFSVVSIHLKMKSA